MQSFLDDLDRELEAEQPGFKKSPVLQALTEYSKDIGQGSTLSASGLLHTEIDVRKSSRSTCYHFVLIIYLINIAL